LIYYSFAEHNGMFFDPASMTWKGNDDATDVFKDIDEMADDAKSEGNRSREEPGKLGLG
jgi:hypothetical protein